MFPKKEEYQKKFLTNKTLLATVKQWKEEGLKVVFTNGCFDLLHIGHLTYLMEASGLGDRLIVGLNSDSSVKGLKGKNRPIHNQRERSIFLASLSYVDGVCVFDECTPLKLIESITPDVLVKGGDYGIEQMVGREIVLNAGGTVKKLKFLKGYSTTSLIQRIKTTV